MSWKYIVEIFLIPKQHCATTRDNNSLCPFFSWNLTRNTLVQKFNTSGRRRKKQNRIKKVQWNTKIKDKAKEFKMAYWTSIKPHHNILKQQSNTGLQNTATATTCKDKYLKSNTESLLPSVVFFMLCWLR